MEKIRQLFYDERQQHWDKVALKLENWKGWGVYYRRRIAQVFKFNISQNQDILEIGCGNGDLLAFLEPKYGLGLDISSKMVALAQKNHPGLDFRQMDAVDFSLDRKFDVVILSDTVNDLWDVQSTLEAVLRHLKPRGRLVINFYNRLWELPLNLAIALGVAKPTLPQNWLTVEDLTNLLNLAGFERVREWVEVLLPFNIPLITPFFNKYLVHMWPFRFLAMTHFMVARPRESAALRGKLPGVSIVVPARNEAGNIKRIFEETPQIGSHTELIFVEGHSSDDTYDEICRQMKAHKDVDASVYKQPGKGKGDAVRLAFSKAKEDVLMILDADLTMPPEDLPRFYNALVSGKGDFINGVRLVYPMEKHAMRPLNLIGNKAFTIIFTYLLGQPIKDTLCGTKVLWKKDYEAICANRAYFGDFDPFGDFELIFGAAKLNLKIVDMPIRYRERTYGTTNIQRWKHGWLLLRMVIYAAGRLKFI
ncbi:MAG: glycosyltransferase [Anaerolineae bacterium]|nr:glycosyltransferase [Anaerolineae bacterium]